MAIYHLPKGQALSQVDFLQRFLAQSIKSCTQTRAAENISREHCIELLGLSAAECLEAYVRAERGVSADDNLDITQYADTIVDLKNRIGGGFSVEEVSPNVVKVVNHCCPFGTSVKESPELCRMTSSVFGAIAARNFGYAKVNLLKRIAINDSNCEIVIHTDQGNASKKSGTEYSIAEDGKVTSSMAGDIIKDDSDSVNPWCKVVDTRSENSRFVAKNIITESKAMSSVFRTIERIAPTNTSVVITGETGTGKEIIARLTHAMSDRSERPFIAINCGAIPEHLIESEIVGFERGAFTGAYRERRGIFERAHMGTIFLDEVNSLPYAAQVKLLRVLQEGEVVRVGGEHPLRVDVRVIAASNQSLRHLVEQNLFRRDLFYRLMVIDVQIPPLRERLDDIGPLSELFLQRLAAKHHHSQKILGHRAWKQIYSYSWPGNVRQLENTLESSFLLSHGHVIDCLVGSEFTDAVSSNESFRDRQKQTKLFSESQFLLEVLLRNSGRVQDAALELGITPRAVYKKISTLGVNLRNVRASLRM